MARIVPKLNLNKIPELVDNHSLIFAKNIRFNSNGISSDFGFDKVSVEHLSHGELDWLEPNEEIVGIIPYNTSFYLFVNNPGTGSYICRYDEVTHAYEQVQCNWNWSGGKIDGIVTVNLNGDVLLTIAEYAVPNGVLVPLKVINLTEASLDDDESIYTQAPIVPIYNIYCDEYYPNVIPAGVYQFFIRYEIRKDFYTNWFPVSKELFTGTSKTILTNQGGLKYIDTKIDSDKSFILDVEKVVNVDGFVSFQLGFVISHDDEVYARAYKKYDINTSRIYFDYDTEYIEEIDVRDLLEPVYDVYNVGNVTAFKNKAYISNYIESDFNPEFKGELDEFIKGISIALNSKESTEQGASFAGYDATFEGPIIKSVNNKSIATIVNIILNSEKKWITHRPLGNKTASLYGITVNLHSTVIDETIIHGQDATFTENVFTDTIDSSIGECSTIEEYFQKISSKIYGVQTNDGTFINSSNVPLSFRLKYYLRVGGSSEHPQFNSYNIDIKFSIYTQDIVNSRTLSLDRTLIPNQGYDFYLHFVRANGEATNGYKINSEPIMVSEVSRNAITLDAKAIYPVFTFSKAIPSEFVACFISIIHVRNNVANVFDIHGITVDGHTTKVGDCLELDTSLYTILNDLSIKVGNDTYIGDYKASYDNSNLLTFGSSGKIVFESTDTPNGYGFLISKYDANPNYAQLIKCTPYITYDGESYTYSNYNQMNLPGYICIVRKLKDNTNYYVAGSDIYNKNVGYDNEHSRYTIRLESIEPNNGDSEITDVNVNDVSYNRYLTSATYSIYSNFNLNFLSLVNNVTPRLVTHSVKVTTTTTDNNVTEAKTEDTNSKTFVVLAFDSITLSEVYELKSMYYSYTRKYYMVYDTNTLIKFDNTIRSSQLEGDEAKINMFKFKVTDYYNVPTDKGIIINLVAVGDNILVHTQDSIYKFSGQNSLTAAGGEDVQMKESEVFDTGIQELFGSEYGYAGLASKDHQILSEFGYTFWDKDSGRIYLYTGNAQMKVLSDDITKLLRRDTISNIYLADDYYNNRIFICIIFSDGKVATLSYDFVAKSFISVHDFAFDWHFKTKTKCYFISNRHDIYKVGTEEGSYGPFVITNYGVYPKHETEDCIVDVIFNDRFEGIKVLNTIEWICNKIVGFDSDFNMAEETFAVIPPENRYKGDYLTLYSDSCRTEQFDIATRSNDTRLKDNLAPFAIKPKVDSYKQVRYNLGKWTFNYFRNILNRGENPVSGRTLGRDDTLIYGKYFVARFVFSRNINFKFEDVTFNVTDEYNA